MKGRAPRSELTLRTWTIRAVLLLLATVTAYAGWEIAWYLTEFGFRGSILALLGAGLLVGSSFFHRGSRWFSFGLSTGLVVGVTYALTLELAFAGF